MPIIVKVRMSIPSSTHLIALSLVPKTIRIYSRDYIMDRHDITYEEYLFTALLQKNDFLPRTDYRSLFGRGEAITIGTLFRKVRGMRGEWEKKGMEERTFFAEKYVKLNRGCKGYTKERVSDI